MLPRGTSLSHKLVYGLTPTKTPAGFALAKNRVTPDLDTVKHSFPRFDSIPESKSSLWLLVAKFGPAMLSKSPIVLEAEGLEQKRFHGRVVVLVDRHTASAAEMIVAFVRENKLAKIVGEPTAGRLLSATSVKVGEGYRLALPREPTTHGKDQFLKGHPSSRTNLLNSTGESGEAGWTRN